MHHFFRNKAFLLILTIVFIFLFLTYIHLKRPSEDYIYCSNSGCGGAICIGRKEFAYSTYHNIVGKENTYKCNGKVIHIGKTIIGDIGILNPNAMGDHDICIGLQLKRRDSNYCYGFYYDVFIDPMPSPL